VRQASLQSGIEENKLRAVGRGGFYKFAVTALNDPTLVPGQEFCQRRCDAFWPALDRDLSRFPDDGVEIEVGQSVLCAQPLGERALAGTRITEDEDFHGGLTPGVILRKLKVLSMPMYLK
jgi:hypothetical protein